MLLTIPATKRAAELGSQRQPMSEIRRVQIHVTQDHINHGDRIECLSSICAMALAITDALGVPCSVQDDGCVYFDGDESNGVPLPDEAVAFVAMWDDEYVKHSAIEPMDFWLEVTT